MEVADDRLLIQALTHRSAGKDHNERLEFLGDAVLELVVTSWLYRQYPNASEGDLTRLRARLVRKESLADLARRIDLGTVIALGGGEMKSGGRHRDSILADSFEALLGAIYLDSGLSHCEALLIRLMGPRLERAEEEALTKDPKTRLQEWLQSRAMALPQYSVIETLGADHAQEFVVQCVVSARALRVSGRGNSRRKAEQQAAARALLTLTEGEA